MRPPRKRVMGKRKEGKLLKHSRQEKKRKIKIQSPLEKDKTEASRGKKVAENITPGRPSECRPLQKDLPRVHHKSIQGKLHKCEAGKGSAATTSESEKVVPS